MSQREPGGATETRATIYLYRNQVALLQATNSFARLTEWDDNPGKPKLVIPVRFGVFWPKRAKKPRNELG